MKSQTLGIVLGLHVAVACLVMQGCKAVKPGSVKPDQGTVVVEPVPEDKIEIEKEDQVPESDITVKDEKPVEVEPLPPPPPPKPVVKPLPPAPVVPATKTIDYVIKSGETLSGIAWRHGVKVNDIVAVNPGMNKDRIFAGRKIKIPSKPGFVAPKKQSPSRIAPVKKSNATAANVKAPAKTKSTGKTYTGPTKEYTVKSGDILGKIAYSNGITIRQLKELNGLTSSNLRIGQKLKVPAVKVAPPVAKKDTADTKAVEPKKPEVKEEEVKEEKPVVDKKEEAPVVEIKDDAKVDENADDKVKVEENAVEIETVPATTNPTYVVKDGEDVLSVAITFGVSPATIMNLNNLPPDGKLTAGQVLKLPEGAKPVKE